MRKILLTAIAAATVLGVTSLYAGPIQDELIQIEPNDIGETLYILSTDNSYAADITVSPLFGSVKVKSKTHVGRHFITQSEITQTKSLRTGFKINGNHQKDGVFSSASNKATGVITTRIGKDDNDYCLVSITYDQDPKPSITADCSQATDFEFSKAIPEENAFLLEFTSKVSLTQPTTDQANPDQVKPPKSKTPAEDTTNQQPTTSGSTDKSTPTP